MITASIPVVQSQGLFHMIGIIQPTFKRPMGLIALVKTITIAKSMPETARIPATDTATNKAGHGHHPETTLIAQPSCAPPRNVVVQFFMV